MIKLSVYGPIDHEYERGNVKIEPGDIVIDAGAGPDGNFTYKASLTARTVIALEPHYSSYKTVVENVGKYPNVGVLRLALWNNNGLVYFDLNKYSVTDALTNNYCEVEAITLDSLLFSLALSNADFLKMDIEGNELEAVLGINLMLPKKISIAAYHDPEHKIPYMIKNILVAKGYTVYLDANTWLIYAYHERNV